VLSRELSKKNTKKIHFGRGFHGLHRSCITYMFSNPVKSVPKNFYFAITK